MRLTKNILRITGITVAVILMLLAGFYFWFVNHAESAIEELVYLQSKGKLKVSIGKISYNYGRKLGLKEVTIYTVDSLAGNTSYRFAIDELHLKAKAIRPLIFHNQLLLDSILIQSPKITITQHQKSGGGGKTISLPDEFGKVYHSIQQALKVLEVKRFQIDNAQFTLIDQTQPEHVPLVLSRLNFQVDNIKVDSLSPTRHNKFFFSDNMVLHTDHQVFTLPSGRHQISFNQFRINIARRWILIDSCTITAIKRHPTSSSFRIFLDSLSLLNVDFPTMTETGILKADSMYCVRPNIQVELSSRDSLRHPRKKPLNIRHVLRNLASDMQVGYIGVKDGSVQLTTEKDDHANTFRSAHDNFELINFKVDTRAEDPVSIGQFRMAIRNYEAYAKDSAYAFRFDSIHFTDNNIRLHHFTIRTSPGARVAVKREYTIPQFELRGFSWPELIYNRKIKATEAVLTNPVLHYTKLRTEKDTGAKLSLYNVFEVLDTLMNLEKISMVNGTLDFTLNPQTAVVLEKVNGTVNTNRLLQATSSGYIERAVEGLSFAKGKVTLPAMNLQLQDAKFDGSTQSLRIRRVALQHKDHSIEASATGLSLNGLLVNDSTRSIQIHRMGWTQANIKAQMTPPKKDSTAKSPAGFAIRLGNIKGARTQLAWVTPEQNISTFIDQLEVTSIAKIPEHHLQVEGLHLVGRDLSVQVPGTSLTVDQYQVTDRKQSQLKAVQLQHYTEKDSIDVSVPVISFVPDLLEHSLQGNLRVRELHLQQAIVKASMHQQQDSTHLMHSTATHHNKKKWPAIIVDEFEANEPVIDFAHSSNQQHLRLILNNEGGKDQLFLSGLRTITAPHHGIEIHKAGIRFGNIRYTNTGEKKAAVTISNLTSTIERIKWQAGTAHKKSTWEALVKSHAMDTLHASHLGKQDGELHLQQFQTSNWWLSPGDVQSLSRENKHWQLTIGGGQYSSAKNHFYWNGLQMNATQQTLSLDSFSYAPSISRDQFIAASPYQTDYIRVHTGAILLHGLDPNRYFHDSIISARSLSMYNPHIDVYRDKRPPFKAGIIKPLPVQMLSKIPVRIAIDSIQLHNAFAKYAELSDKTHLTGTIPFTGLNATLHHVKNFDLQPADSFHLHASARLLDTIPVQLHMRESYTDSLAGFLMTVQMEPADLTILNPVLEPLASVKLPSGKLNSMHMRVVGRDHLSLGEMQLYYNQLKVQFLKNGQETKKTFLTGLMTFVANRFVIRHKNNSRTGLIYFPRYRDRSIFNYWIKMTLSGAASSVGAKRNKKYLRQYQKALKEMGLPPISLGHQ